MSREELLSPGADPIERAEETTLRPRRLDEFVGQERLKEHLEILLARGAPARAGGRPSALRGTAGNRQDVVGRHRRRRARGRAARHQRARARTSRRPRRHPHQSRRRRRALHRRGPPSPARRRRGPLSGDGGLPARHRHRQGAVGAVDPPRLAALHARRCHDPDGAHHRSAARPLRPRVPPRLLRGRGPGHDPRARRRHPRRAARVGRRTRDRRARPRHSSRRQPPAQARARLRRGTRRRDGERGRPPVPP